MQAEPKCLAATLLLQYGFLYRPDIDAKAARGRNRILAGFQSDARNWSGFVGCSIQEIRL